MTRTAIADGQLSDMLSRGVRHLNAGENAQAETLLETALAARPGLPQALMLLGAVRLAQARAGDAVPLLTRALAASPGQPMVLLYLGNARRALGEFQAAAAAYRAALGARPVFPEAELALAGTLLSLGKTVEAEQLYRAHLRREPQSAAALAGLGEALNDQERHQEAEQILSAALALPMEDTLAADIENALGAARMRQRRFAEALPHFERAIALAPAALAAERNRATVQERLNRTDRAISAYRRVLAREPLDLKTHLLLNELLHRTGRDGEFLRSYDEAARARPGSPVLPAAKADQLLLLERAAEAVEYYERALRLDPAHVSAHIGLGRAHKALGEPGAALAAFQAGQKTCPGNPDLQTAHAFCLLGQGESRRAQSLAEQAVAGSPFAQAALAVLGLCYRANRDDRDEALNAYDDFVQVFDLAPPDGYGDLAAFHRDLGAHLGELHGASRQFFSQTLRGGTRAPEEIFHYRHAVRDGLKQRVIAAVESYIRAMKDKMDHPFLGRRRGAFRFSGSWSSRMQDGGFHVNHIHSGWISSVYYVDVPDVTRDSTARQGWLKFGEPSSEVVLKDAVRRFVQPVPGRLVLFPSYMWHGTVPYHSPQARTTIAFDAIPV